MTEGIKHPTKCLIPVLPLPHYGMAMSIMMISKQFDKIVICVNTEESVFPLQNVVQMLKVLFQEPKFEIIIHPANFNHVNRLPNDLPNGITNIAVLSQKVYVNLTSKGIPCILIPQPVGFHDVFLARAYYEGIALDNIRLTTKLSKFEIQKE